MKLRMVRAAALGWGREACHPTKRLLQQDIVTRGKVQGVAWEGDVLAKKPQNILHEKVSVSLERVCAGARVGGGSVGSSMTVPAQSLMSAKLKRPGSISLYRSHQ